jgi:hypothetical protein
MLGVVEMLLDALEVAEVLEELEVLICWPDPAESGPGVDAVD